MEMLEVAVGVLVRIAAALVAGCYCAHGLFALTHGG